MNVTSIREQFPLIRAKPKLAYFDNAATSQKHESVIQAMDIFYRSQNAPVHRSVYKLAEGATEAYENVRNHVREFLNAKHREEIIFTAGTTASINTVVSGLAEGFRKGDRILLTDMEHHSMIVPWQAAAARKGLRMDFAPLTHDGRLDMPAFKTLLAKRPKFVGITHVSNVLGTVNPVRAIVRLAHRIGAVVLVDATQAAAHMPLDVRKLDCDFLVFSGHKVYGPNGVGVLYGKRELLKQLPPFIYGGHMIERVGREGAIYAEPPAKFEGGTPPVPEVVGLGAALTFLQKLGWKSIRKHEHKLTTYALTALQSVSGLILLGPTQTKGRAPIFSFALPGVHPHDGSALLDREGIAVRGGHHCTQILHESYTLSGSMRVSLGIYNTKEEIDRLVVALAKVRTKLYG
ncbi:hypothetical protein A3C21_01805 [Candidatus Kaiserbacteria bacterium RIFCSPHIGHO2_02_FULL_59_21]|uniref:Cysteine desulfurase n=2 Tax=Candidatus Kaiseribacteriota TaxID=1752734 RepID=A0A0G2B1Z5_9BACT|nr:MAG: Cysteine desulfurase, SufS family [Candidatus Kaiserbacteria bacterium GW2011_GWA2_58_9]OGG61604.1 MAG: hypothetical protein A2766_02895 [Candidatus Kaiserbacteria bacterium RIFCSPHIGHO2_01_FULL_58_22]OGG66866.1 MAG: hypothetical protein A3C21_01805 [Candidatus Kaiserbacteria bacterium RIFCSPHIGHO2_02_FULL_59_21]OGG80753.1 MAG: hypothetical protein A2952_01680 [Candidatus Kaiserbacteria bacterium RIFCSPLOWO2_01_FULL_59_34]OGG86228.1 MAG: hypothetical protein A3I47_03265 [Candidatus Kais